MQTVNEIKIAEVLIDHVTNNNPSATNKQTNKIMNKHTDERTNKQTNKLP